MTHLPTIEIKVIPHKKQKYDTAGDYYSAFNEWAVRISELPDWRYEGLVLIHEITEMLLTRHNNVSWIDIDEFDRFGEGKDHPDPGTLENAPYHKEHMIADQVERAVAAVLGVDWAKYNEALDSLER